MSVHRPGFYADRFFKFMSNMVFKKSSCELNLCEDAPFHVASDKACLLEEPQTKMSDSRLFCSLLAAEPDR